jgi:hypothetical protein
MVRLLDPGGPDRNNSVALGQSRSITLPDALVSIKALTQLNE